MRHLALAAVVVTCSLPAVALAQAPPVTRVVAAARPPRYEGPCPARFEFVGTIYSSYPITVTYRWERSDHATGPVQSVRVQGTQNVVATWQLGGGPGRVFHGSETLHVLSPVNMYSNPANFSMFCR